MQNILLVEPNYKSKFPPIGLMKISTFHKEYRKDYVKFVKGIVKTERKWDRIYITTLFTFDFKIVIETIQYYKLFVKKDGDIIIGGILASLLPNKVYEATGIFPFVGIVNSAVDIGYNEFKEIDIDNLIIDYDILSEVEYKYSNENSYFITTTRGCPNKCRFCAVPILEPIYKSKNDIKQKIKKIDKKYGRKRDLYIMDNNILYSRNIKEICEEIYELGFCKSKKTYIMPIEFKEILKRILRREKLKEYYLEEIEKDINELIKSLKKEKKVLEKSLDYRNIIDEIDKIEKKFEKLDYIKQNYKIIIRILKKMKRKTKYCRYVDFNQGIDSRLLTEDKMRYLSKLNINPFRIAFDDLNLKNIYINAIRLSSKYGIKYFSNYILYNFEDKPTDLWERLYINIELSEELKIPGLFSFPMKYSSIETADRKYLGKEWKKYQLSNLYAILNAQKGIVPKSREYFYSAFGKNGDEFIKILDYPRDFIIYRNFFKKIGYTERWNIIYNNLSEEDYKKFVLIRENKKIEYEKSEKLEEALFFINIKKREIEFIEEIFKNKNLIIDYDKILSILKELYVKKISRRKHIEEYLK